MDNLAEDDDPDGGLGTRQDGGPAAFLLKLFILSSLIALLAWWFVFS